MSRGKYAKAISDRSGFKFDYKDMVIEPGTGHFVHKSESDGPMYNLIDHPQNKILLPKKDEGIGLPNATNDVSVVVTSISSSIGGVQYDTPAAF